MKKTCDKVEVKVLTGWKVEEEKKHQDEKEKEEEEEETPPSGGIDLLPQCGRRTFGGGSGQVASPTCVTLSCSPSEMLVDQESPAALPLVPPLQLTT